MLGADVKKRMVRAQGNEITEHVVYGRLASIVKIRAYADVLEKISQEERRHYDFFKAITGEEVLPDRFKIFIYVLVAKVFGLNFGLKLMEHGEDRAQGSYAGLEGAVPGIKAIEEEERKHEYELLELIDEDRLKYISSVVLGLNDALVEFTASLAGFTLALQKSRLIGVVGFITGIAASASMSASEYLSTKQEETDKNPLTASVYTGIAYVIVVALLVAPYFLFENVFFSLALVVATALIVIAIFTFYMATVRNLVFKDKFTEMAGLSLGIAAITFFLGLAIRKVFGVEV